MPEHAEAIAHDYLRDDDHLRRGRPEPVTYAEEASEALDAVSTQAAVEALRDRLDSLDKAMAMLSDRLTVALLPERPTEPVDRPAAMRLPCSPLTDELLRQAERIDQATDFAHRLMRRLAL